jgi:hypothetical protein
MKARQRTPDNNNVVKTNDNIFLQFPLSFFRYFPMKKTFTQVTQKRNIIQSEEKNS